MQAAALLMCGVLFGLLGLAVQPAHAADAQSAIDPPGRVGRLSDITGQVWLFSPDAGEWVSADRNRPLTSGDRLSTDAASRAEVRIGSTTLRLDGGSELEVVQLDDDHITLQLHSGAVAARLRQRDIAAQFELRTAEGRFRVQRAGRYRFDRIDDTSHATVLSGQAQYEGPGSALTIASGQRAEFWVDGRNAAQYSITEPLRDAFASWNSDRDRTDDRSASSRYVSPEMTGIEDLDRNGRWEQTPEYGALWTPRAVDPGWAPYAAGHWAFVRPWGWTWVDAAPWGFAPFHYGRWVWFRNAWGWAPGTYVARPVYAPALVGWVGGPQVSVSISIGGGGPSVGWFPLAPREVYVPSYRVSPRYVQNVNITHVTNITNITTIVNNPQAAVGRIDYSNRKFPHAVTVVPQSVMTARQPVAPAAAQWRQAHGGEDGREGDAARRGGNRSAQSAQAAPLVPMALAAAPVAAPVIARREERRPIDSAPAAPATAAVKGGVPGALPTPVPGGAVVSTTPAAIVPPPPSRMNRPVLRAAEETAAPGAAERVNGSSTAAERSRREGRGDQTLGPAVAQTLPVVPQTAPARALPSPAQPTIAAPPVAATRAAPVVPQVSPPVPATAVVPAAPARVAKPMPPVNAMPQATVPASRPVPAADAQPGRMARPPQANEAGTAPRAVPAVPQAAVPPTSAQRAEPTAAQRRADGQRSPVREVEPKLAPVPGREAAAPEARKNPAQERRGEPRERGQAN